VIDVRKVSAGPQAIHTGLSRQFLQQFLPDNRNIVRRIRTDPYLIAFYFQYGDCDPFAVRGFNDEGFAWAAGEDEHVQFSFCLMVGLLPWTGGRCRQEISATRLAVLLPGGH
jgi:hypothetical protein